MIEWTDNIPMGTSIDSVKQIQPNFIEIDWNKPDTIDWIKSDTLNNETRYFITKIKNDNDMLKMDNYLYFVNGKYQGRFAHK